MTPASAVRASGECLCGAVNRACDDWSFDPSIPQKEKWSGLGGPE